MNEEEFGRKIVISSGVEECLDHKVYEDLAKIKHEIDNLADNGFYVYIGLNASFCRNRDALDVIVEDKNRNSYPFISVAIRDFLIRNFDSIDIHKIGYKLCENVHKNLN